MPFSWSGAVDRGRRETAGTPGDGRRSSSSGARRETTSGHRRETESRARRRSRLVLVVDGQGRTSLLPTARVWVARDSKPSRSSSRSEARAHRRPRWSGGKQRHLRRAPPPPTPERTAPRRAGGREACAGAGNVVVSADDRETGPGDLALRRRRRLSHPPGRSLEADDEDPTGHGTPPVLDRGLAGRQDPFVARSRRRSSARAEPAGPWWTSSRRRPALRGEGRAVHHVEVSRTTIPRRVHRWSRSGASRLAVTFWSGGTGGSSSASRERCPCASSRRPSAGS